MMSLDLDEALRRAADGPPPQWDTGRVVARGMRRRHWLQAGAAGSVALLVLAVAVAVVGLRPTAAPIVGTIEEAPESGDGVVSEHTPVGFAAARLAVLPGTVPAGHVPDTVLVNDGAVSLFATPQCSLDQWEDDGWIDLEQSRFDRPYEIAPGEPGPWQSCLADTFLGRLEPGRYRIRWQVTAGGPRLDQPRLTVTGEFEIIDSDRVEPFAPLPAGTQPAPPDEMPHEELADAMGLMEGEVPFLFTVPDSEIQLPVRAREGEWPLIAATSCEVLSSVQLPQGWSGLCLERTFAGQRLTDRRYPYGTTSVATIGEEPNTPPVMSAEPPASCPVTVPSGNFSPPSGHPAQPPELYQARWYGTPELWTMLRTGGVTWQAGTGQKLFFWSDDYQLVSELTPALSVTAERIDQPGTTITTDRATNGYRQDVGSFMVSGISPDDPGCWQITATYRDADLSFTVWVAPSRAEPGEAPTTGDLAEHRSTPLPDPEVVDGQAVVPLRLPDGTRLELGVPAKLDFASYGFDSSVPAVRLPGFGRDAMVLYGTREQVRERMDATVLETYPDQRGGEVEFWRLQQDEVDHLAFEFGPWTVLYYDYREGGAGPRMTDQDRQLFAESLLGDVDEDGFLVVEATPPLEFYAEGAHAAGISITGDSGTITITNARCDPYPDQPLRGPGDDYLHWCDEGTGFSLRVFADSEVLDAVEDHVTVARAD